MFDLIDLWWAVGCGLFCAAVYLALHFARLGRPANEYYARPLFYGVGFGTYLVFVWVWGLGTGHTAEVLMLTVLGFLAGMGMLLAFVLEHAQERVQDAEMDAAIHPAPNEDAPL